MQIRHWNATREGQAMTGVLRYENELYTALERVTPADTWTFDRIRRHENLLLGSTIASWAFSYRVGDADVVHLTEETILPATVLHRPRSTVVTCHGLIPLRYPSTIQDVTTRFQWVLVPRLLESADRVIAISEFTRSEILDLTDVPPERIDVVHHGIDHERYRPLDQAACREDLDIEFDSDKQYVLVVASTLEQKRMDLVRAAFDRIRSARDDVVLLKAGYAETLDEPWAQNTGWVDEADMPKLYNAADVFFHPSEYESFGFPVLEAMACGTPVVASDRASIPELVGETAPLLDPDEPDAGETYASHILDRLDDRIDTQAVSRSERFTWDRTARQVLETYGRAR